MIRPSAIGAFARALALVAIVACRGASSVELEASRAPMRYVIPEGYVGWVRVDYGVTDAHAPGYGVSHTLALPVREGVRIVQFPPAGQVVTSSPMHDGSARDEYFYVASSGALTPLSQAHDTGMVWNRFNGRLGGAATQIEMFFVGSAADYRKYGYRHDAVPMPGPIKR